MKLRRRIEKFRRSLFYVPTLYTLVAIAAAQGSLQLDLSLTNRAVKFPAIFGSTVESARALLAAVAGATIGFAGIAFSVSLLLFQLASNQFSPRVLYAFFRDPFSKRVMGVAVGTFTYCLLVLRAVRKPLEESATAVIPNVSVVVAVVLGIVAVLAVLAFINHTAHSMEAAEVIRRITEETHSQIARLCPDAAGTRARQDTLGQLPEGEAFVVRSSGDGWVEQIHSERLVKLPAPGGVIVLDTGAGEFVTRGTPMATIRPAPRDPAAAERAVRGAIHLGRTRTMLQDMAYGFRQLVDIALRALSPGINDPTTAREAIVHIGSALLDLMTRDLPGRILPGDDGRRLFRPRDLTYADYVDLAFDEIRVVAADTPVVAQSVLDVLAMLSRELEEAGLSERAALIKQKAALVLADCERAGLGEHDLEPLRRAAERV